MRTTFAVLICIAIGLVLLVSMYLSYSNREIRLRNQIDAVQTDNQSRFDNMWKKITQVAKVTDAQKNALKEILIGYAEARNTGKANGALATWIHESVPNVDTSTFNNLQNIIAGSRDAWTTNQTHLIDLKREHDNVRTTFPGSLFLAGRPPVKITIITSERTEQVFSAGKDDDVSLPVGSAAVEK